MADSLIDAFAADATDIAAQIGRQALEELLAAHRLWSDWLREGRVRKIAFVAEKTETPNDSGLTRRAGFYRITRGEPPRGRGCGDYLLPFVFQMHWIR